MLQYVSNVPIWFRYSRRSRAEYLYTYNIGRLEHDIYIHSDSDDGNNNNDSVGEGNGDDSNNDSVSGDDNIDSIGTVTVMMVTLIVLAQ